MPKQRTKENKDLPQRWRFKHNAYYYRVPAGDEIYWDHKKEYRLGSTFDEAMIIFNHRLDNMAVSLDVDTDKLLDVPDLLAIARPVETYAVYFLFKNDEVVYVGRSSTVFTRMECHNGVKVYDSYAIVACESEEEMQIMEKRYIAKLKPLYNIYNLDN